MRIAAFLLLLASTTTAAAGPVKPATIAEDVLDAQLPQVPRAPDDDEAHRRARYAEDTVLLGSTDNTVGKTAVDYVTLIPTIGSIQVDRSHSTSLVAGGDAHV